MGANFASLFIYRTKNLIVIALLSEKTSVDWASSKTKTKPPELSASRKQLPCFAGVFHSWRYHYHGWFRQSFSRSFGRYKSWNSCNVTYFGKEYFPSMVQVLEVYSSVNRLFTSSGLSLHFTVKVDRDTSLRSQNVWTSSKLVKFVTIGN